MLIKLIDDKTERKLCQIIPSIQPENKVGINFFLAQECPIEWIVCNVP